MLKVSFGRPARLPNYMDRNQYPDRRSAEYRAEKRAADQRHQQYLNRKAANGGSASGIG